MTKKDLKYKPDAFEQAKFEYSSFGKVFTDGLDKSDRNEGLLKRLKNIEDRNNNQLLAIKILRPANYSVQKRTKKKTIDYKDYLKMHNYCTREPYSFMMIDVRPTASVPFKKNFDEPINI